MIRENLFILIRRFSRHPAILGCLWTCLLGLGQAQSRSDTQLVFHPTFADSPQHKITFYAVCNPGFPVDADLQNFQQASTQKNEFTIYLDPKGTLAKYGGLTIFTVYLADYSHQLTPSWEKCTVKESSLGNFVDRVGTVDFSISSKKQEDSGSFDHMPLYCVCSTAAIEIEPVETPSKLDISSDDGIMVRITNKSDSLKTTVTGLEEANYTNSSYWNATEPIQLGDGKPFDLGPGESVDKPVRIRPKYWKALAASLKSRNSGQGETSIGIKVGSSTYDGSNKSARANLQIRFNTPWVFLILALILGSLLGALTKLFAHNQVTTKKLLFTLAMGLVFAAGLWLVAILGKSKFALYGLELDPLQALSATGIGFLASGGTYLFKALRIKIPGHGGAGGTH